MTSTHAIHSVTRPVLSTVLALVAALPVSFASPGNAQACGPYGMDDSTLVEWAVADHLMARQDIRGEPARTADKPAWTIGDIEVLGKRVALAQVVWTNGQTSETQYFTLIRTDGRWRLIGSSTRVSRLT